MVSINYMMVIEYDGTRYNGWQKQHNTDNTIQGKLESILSRYFSDDIEVHGSGRTDAGVHAKGQVANFKVHEKSVSSTSSSEIMKDLNSYLPEDIRIVSLKEADPRFHARLNAKSKTYRYCIDISDKKDVFLRKYSMLLNKMPDIELMRTAAEKFLGEHDLAGFSDTKTKKSTVRRIDSISFSVDNTVSDRHMYIDFTGNGFLYHTVRLITGTLLSIGLGESNIDIIDSILSTGNRKQVPFMAPAEGLFLMEVRY